MKKIFLVGLPGTGKSTLGEYLGQTLSLDFFDLDAEIEQSTGKLIKDIFHDHGESEFREMEHEALLRVTTENSSFVLATGGGTPCFFDHMAYLNSVGLTVYLSTPIDNIVDRIRKNEDRPLMSGVDPKEKLTALLRDRELYYQQASLHIDSSTTSYDEIALEIEKAADRRFR